MLEDKQEMIAVLTGIKSSKKSYYTQLKMTVEQLRKKNMQLAIINEVMKSFKVDVPIDDILQNVFNKLKKIIHCDQLSLLLCKGERLILSNAYPQGSRIIEVEPVHSHHNSLLWKAIDSKKTISNQIKAGEEFYEKPYFLDLHLKNVLVLPLFIKNKSIGVLTIGSHQSTEWSRDDITFLEQLRDHLAVCIENTQLYNEVVRSKQEWENTFKAVDDKIIVFDKNLVVLQFNESAGMFFNIEEPASFFHSLENECKALIEESLHSQKPAYGEIYFQNGSICETCTYPIHNKHQGVSGVILYMKDVTEKRKMEAQLLHSGKLAAIGEMAAGIAHELNSPLTAIIGNSQLLLRDITKGHPSHMLLNDIKNCGSRCTQIIKSLLTFSRQEEYMFESFSLNEAVEQVLNLLKHQLDKTNIKLDLQLQEDLPDIEGSQQQIEQVIVNFILNAKDALELSFHEKKNISIKTFLNENFAELSVQDNGIGIEESRLSEIFHPFYTTKETGKGTGLGLSVSFGIAKAHSGTIEVYSKVNEGSIFKLILPLLSGDEVMES